MASGCPIQLGGKWGPTAIRQVRFRGKTGPMAMPFSEPPTDNYRTDGDATVPDWHSPYEPDSAATPAVRPTAEFSAQHADSQLERRAITVRIVIALVLAVPLTAIAGGIMGGGLSSLLGMALAWAGIALVVYLSHGKGFPFPRS